MVAIITFSSFLQTFGVLAAVIFVLTSMLGMGFSLTIGQIITPLRNTRLVLLALAANFILAPLLALIIVWVFPLREGLSIGLFVMGISAGAPFLHKLAQVAKGDNAFSVGLMVLLIVVTIIYVPVVPPLFLPGITINPLDIAQSLILLMLLPLVIALCIRARYEEVANGLLPLMTQAANLSLLFLFVAYFVVYFSVLVGIVGTTAILAAAVFVLVSLFIGYFLGGSASSIKKVLALGTAQRNLSAALAISTLNFTDPDVMSMIIVVAMVGLILLMFIGGEMGKRTEITTEDVQNQKDL